MSSNQENTWTSKSSFDKTHPNTISKDLPSDIIFQILTRTSLETLDACKSVCTEWDHLTRESSFMPLYCDRTNTVFGYFIQDIIRNNFVSMFVSIDQAGQNSSSNIRIRNIPRDMRILASCDQGILCCLRRNDKDFRYCVGKPATEQWQHLPNPKLRYQTVAIAITVMKATPLHYGIVRLSKQGSTWTEYIYKSEIFDSKTWTWMTEQYINLPDSEIVNSTPSLSTGNSINWLTNEDNVLQFRKDKQFFHKFPLPEYVQNNRNCQYKQLVNYKGKLGLTYLTEESNMDVWVRQKDPSNKMKWMKKTAVNIKSLELSVKYPSPLSFYNDEIAVMKAFNEVIFYNLQDGTFSRVKLDHGLTMAEEVFQFRSDFEPVDLRGTT